MTSTSRTNNPIGASAHGAGEGGSDVASSVIPYKNPKALIGYYLAVFSILGFFPLIGIIGTLMGFAALVLGFLGLRDVKANPQVKGTAHAWIGIILGGGMALVTGAWQTFMLLAILSGPHH